MVEGNNPVASGGSPLPDEERLARGAEVFERVYSGVIPLPPPGLLDYSDLMLGQLFAENWARPELGFKERRLLTLAVIAANGDADTWGLHLEAALRNGELTAAEARECVVHLTPYVGYPRTSPLLLKTEAVIAKVAKAAEAAEDAKAAEAAEG